MPGTVLDVTALRIEYMPLDDVAAADRNAREHDVPAIARSMATFGLTDPPFLDERTGQLIAGHGRAKALRLLRERATDPGDAPVGVQVDPDGAWLVPVTRGWSSTSAAHADAANLALNRIGDLGGYDDQVLVEILTDLHDVDTELAEAAGYSADDLDALIAATGDAPAPDGDPAPDGGDDDVHPDDDPDPGSNPPISAGDLETDLAEDPENHVDPAPLRATCAPGEVWLMPSESGAVHRLAIGDCTDPQVLAAALGGQRARIVIADPPYGMRLDTDYDMARRSKTDRGRFGKWTGNEYEQVHGDHADYDPGPVLELVRGVAEQFWFGADYYAERLPARNEGSWLVWDKRTPTQADGFGSEFELAWSRVRHKRRMLRHPWFGMLAPSEDAKDAANRVHPTQKPVSLYAAILGAWSKPGDVLLDPYGGSGTGMVAAERTGRTAAVVELDPAYCDVILMRYARTTGRTAYRESDGERFVPLAGI